MSEWRIERDEHGQPVRMVLDTRERVKPPCTNSWVNRKGRQYRCYLDERHKGPCRYEVNDG